MKHNYERHVYEDFLELCKFQSSLKVKRRMLAELLAQDKDYWAVVGITLDALEKFIALSKLKGKAKEELNSRTGKLRIQRAHIVSRKDTYEYVLNNKLEFSEWGDYLRKRDKTILALSSENKGISRIHVYRIDNKSGLFRNGSFKWTHGQAETDFLEKLYGSRDKIKRVTAEVLL
jgi:hypothetical protein